MKKTRKLLSVVLSLLVVMGSLPVVYTAAADAVNVTIAEEGTIENPTVPVSESGEYRQEEVNNLTAVHKSLNFTFYQTMDNQYFRFAQLVQMEKYCGSWNTITVYINSYNFNGNDARTVDFFNYRAGEFLWTAGTTDSGRTNFPNGFEAAGTILGCTDYSWSLDIIFKGLPKEETGETNIGYSHVLDYTVTANDVTTSYQTPIETNIKIIDARQLVAEIEKAENIIANADEYTDEYVSSVKATLNTIPEDLKDFSGLYTQSQIDNYVKMFKDISKNSADYTEYNTVYKNLTSITNARGAFTDDSFDAFKAELKRINDNLPKNLDYTRQQEVDDATQALRDAYNLLVATDLSKNNTGASYTTNGDDGDMTFTVDNTAFKFMQTKDNQVFEYNQMWTIRRSGGNTDRNFGGMILHTSSLANACDNSTCRLNQTPAINNTDVFVSRLTSDSVATITANNEVGNSVTAPELLCWTEYTDATATIEKATTIIDTTGSYIGALDSDRNYAYSNNMTYYLQSSPKFTGNPAGTYGAISTNYVLRTGWNYKTGGFLGMGATKHSSHIHVNSTIEVTDVRQLISAVAEANETIANPGNHSEAYITALKAAVDSVPETMLRGVDYYTQDIVDKLYQDITTIPEAVADYSEFVEVFEMMQGINADKYTEDSFKTFSDTIYTINQNLAKNLTVDQQAIVDEAVDALYAAHDKLISKHLNDDNVYTQNDIQSTLGNNPLEFSIATTQYNFMLTEDGQKFALGIDLSARKTRTDYNAYIRELGFSTTIPAEPAVYCTSDDFCHHLDSIDPISKDHTAVVVNAVTGVTPLAAANSAGVVSEYTTWKNTSGTALTSGGYLIDNASVSSSESTAHAEMYFTGATGDQEAKSGFVDATYALWFGWYYVQPFFGDESLGDELYRHVHIPVNVKITDARALNTLYGQVEDILNGNSETDYTFEALVNIYNAYTDIPADMVNGDNYYSQESVDAEYAKLKEAFEQLEEGADYSEYFEAYIKAQEIISTGNDDGYGNALYDEEAFNNYVTIVEAINNGLDKNLKEDGQGAINQATSDLLLATNTLEATKQADYTELGKAMEEAKKMLEKEKANPGTYTQETITALEKAYEDAVNLDKTFSANEENQSAIDGVTEALKNAIDNTDFRADYSEFEDAYSQIKDIVENPDKYTQATVDAAEKALEEADKLNKDLPDFAQNRVTIENATNALQSVIDNAKEIANYDGLDEALEDAKEIVNAPEGTYTDKTVEEAQKAIDAAEALNKDLEKTDENQQKIDDVISDLIESATNAKEKADYDGLEEALEDAKEIVNAPEGTYTDKTVEEAQKAIDAAEALDKDLEKTDENQQKIENVISDLIDSVTNAKEKADYSDFNEALDKLDEILNAPEGTYTDKTIEEAQNAKDAAEALDKDLPVSEQGTIDSVTDIINGAVNGVEEKADYSEFNEVVEKLEEIVNNPDNFTEETVENAKEALDNANKVDPDLPATEQGTLDEIVEDLKEVINNAQEKADYSDFNEALDKLDEILNAPEGTYTDKTIEEAQNAKDAADALDKELPASEQGAIDSVTDIINGAVNDAEEKADYSEFEAAKDVLEEIVNNPDKYTEETVENAKEALDNANKVDPDLPASEQGTLDEIVEELKEVINNAQEKADYSDFNEVVEKLEEIVNNPGKYTEETVENAKEALDNANKVDPDLPSSEQDTLDQIVEDLKEVINNAQETADYTEYNKAKAEADSLVNDDGNGNPIYDEDAFQAFKEAVNNVDLALEKNLEKNEENQAKIDNAVAELESLKTVLDEKKYYTIIFKDADGNVLGEAPYVNGDTFGNIATPELPEDTDETAYFGWAYEDGTLAKPEDIVKGELNVTIASEDKKLIAKDESGVTIDEVTSFVSGIEAGTTVEEVLSKFDNDELVIEIKTYEGVDLASEELVGTGSTITLKSKYTGVVYETRMFIIMGDVDGDGDVDDNDYETSKLVGHGAYEYPENHNYFFVANDIDENGLINALDVFYIGRMRSF